MSPAPQHHHTIILGAGAAGMMCAAEAARSGKSTLILDHARTPGDKIRISGGGRCNFTNLYTRPENFLSENTHFAKSALSRYTQWDFIDLVARHGIAYHEKTLGQLFCDESAKDIIRMLRNEMQARGATLWCQATLDDHSHADGLFTLNVTHEGTPKTLTADNLVIATGGKSIPKMGATGLGYQIAAHYGLRVTDTRAALVPLTFTDQTRDQLSGLAGLSVPATVRAGQASFEEGLLFTHRGLSGPSILQASSYWREGDPIHVTLGAPQETFAALRHTRQSAGGISITNALARHIPKRLAEIVIAETGLTGTLADQSDAKLRHLAETLTNWTLTPNGSEGYRTAEVTLGGVDTAALNARTMEARQVPGLYFIGEVVDVTGWLGGYNFQWAWSSGWAAGQAIATA